jgi:hypothetical protein
MKFISLFGKTPDHKKFGFKPRYWDQEAEERKEREERIRKEIERERGLQPDTDSPDSYRERIAGSFQAARRRSDKPKEELNKVLIRSGALLFLVLFLMAFLQWGNDALYGLVIFIPLYFYMRFKR